MKNLKNIIAIVIFISLIFVFRDKIQTQFLQLQERFFPCRNPIAYSIGTFDNRFGISKTDFLTAVKQAEDIWEKPIGVDLFSAKSDGKLKINLLYDYRQNATKKLQTLGLSVDKGKASYDAIETRYTALKEQYLSDKNVLVSRIAILTDRQDAYNQNVVYWNKRHGVPEAEYNALQLEKQSIQTELNSINQMQDTLNVEVGDINTLANTLNLMAKELNLNVVNFNEIGNSLGDEFEEGLYKSGPDGESIDIYQYDSKARLVRVLAHELGHALGLDHLDNPKAIMYKLNQATNDKLTADDLSALKAHCGLK